MKSSITLIALIINLNSLGQIQPGLYFKIAPKYSSFNNQQVSLKINMNKTFKYHIENADCFFNSSHSVEGSWELSGSTLILIDSSQQKKPASKVSSVLISYTSVRKTFYRLNFISNTLTFIKVIKDDGPELYNNTWGNFKL